ncbi:MAG: hypothetical protein IPL15_02125 [Comamonadaceae bacterium]|uniref:hypothetical protein n=1 Tax=Candidatus Skiveiella danica TaxID=3386177 RepID=UPI00390BCC3B|nr:hypothetical protein [Comamonadaceae bacterium]
MKTQELKAKARHELIEYGVNVVYLTLVFAAFTVYRRILLAEHGVTHENYGFAVIEALVLGKVIMLGDGRLGRGLEARPLIFPTLYKTLVFSALVAAFKVVEFGIKGLWQGVGFAGGLMLLSDKWSDELLANGLVLLVALIPFFAIKELGRVLGKDRLSSLFFR